MKLPLAAECTIFLFTRMNTFITLLLQVSMRNKILFIFSQTGYHNCSNAEENLLKLRKNLNVTKITAVIDKSTKTNTRNWCNKICLLVKSIAILCYSKIHQSINLHFKNIFYLPFCIMQMETDIIRNTRYMCD